MSGGKPSPSDSEDQEVLQGYAELYSEVANAVKNGDVDRFNRFYSRQQEFCKQASLRLYLHLRLICWRNLIYRVYRLNEGAAQQDLSDYNAVFKWVDKTMGEDDVISMLSRLMTLGGLKGYLHWGKGKVVFAKSGAFPAMSNWSIF